ncbi:hypothetical protein PG996_015685 [Apiospora saccharicola]|uniref:Uncharacterized protein n=1 Tax=Apiospora saccharicola TaxID=335842 RepID=A0ABR1TLV2_9PEZI
MPADEYSSFGGGGALKLKGGKVTKHKKKKKDRSGAGSDLEKSLSTGASKSEEKKKEKKSREPGSDEEGDTRKKRDDGNDDDGEAKLVEYKTEAERRHEEFQRKKVSRHPPWKRRGYLLRNKKEILTLVPNLQLLKLSESSSSRPELLKTHKERVEELNTYLSKLSEHHDMPKIGPG